MEQWQQGICNEKSGFLFSHPCDRMANQACSTCNRPICNEHAHYNNDNRMVCTTCAKKTQGVTRKHQRRSRYSDDDFYDDPYFYGPRYGGYWYRRGGHTHHDRHDFTEADGESFMMHGDDEFETDMTES